MFKPYWHIHHEVLMEFNTEPIENRIDYIETHKALKEIPIRLKLLQPVQGKLPSAVVEVGDAFVEAWDAYYKAQDAYSKARDAYYKDGDAYYKDGDARNKAGYVYGKAYDAYIEARDAYDKALNDHMPEIEALHKIECPNCPWNGKTIFPEV